MNNLYNKIFYTISKDLTVIVNQELSEAMPLSWQNIDPMVDQYSLPM